MGLKEWQKHREILWETPEATLREKMQISCCVYYSAADVPYNGRPLSAPS